MVHAPKRTINRYYDPATGQFVSVDPMVNETGQPYLYAGDDPVNGVDPDGLCLFGGSWCNGIQNAIASTFDNFRHQTASLVDLPPNLILGTGTSIYNAYDNIYQDGANGCSFFSSKNLSSITWALTEDLSAGLVADGGGEVADAADEELVNLANPERTIHILYGDASGGGHLWPGLPGKSVFPANWSAGEVMNAISDVATNPQSSVVSFGGIDIIDGTYDGVDVRVIYNPSDDEIISGYPTNVQRNP
jgi:Bacterial EndoU nuclease